MPAGGGGAAAGQRKQGGGGGRRKITLKNISGQTIKVKGEVIKNNEERSLGRFECREHHKIDINDENGKDLLVKQIHIKRRAKHLIFSKMQDGKFALCKRDKSGNIKPNADINEDEPDDLVDEEDKADEKEDEGAPAPAPDAAAKPAEAGEAKPADASAAAPAPAAAGATPS